MSLGGFRALWQPLRPFLAGTKFTQYIMLRENERNSEASRSPRPKMLSHLDINLSPPATPSDLTFPTSTGVSTAVSNSPLLAAAPVTNTTTTITGTTGTTHGSGAVPSSPQISYDGVTFVANVSNLFSVTPTSPPESEVDPTEVSLFLDVGKESVVSEEQQDGGDSPQNSSSSPLASPSSLSASMSPFGEVLIDADMAEAAIQAVQSAPDLGPAVSSMLETGSVGPLIREELKCTIQSKRLRNGHEELAVEDRRPVQGQLTPEEELRRQKRRERNKIAAQKCREKKLQKARELTEETDQLEAANARLKSECQSLAREIEKLRNMMVHHDKSTQCELGQKVLKGLKILKVAEIMPVTKPPAKIMEDDSSETDSGDEVEDFIASPPPEKRPRITRRGRSKAVRC